MAAQTPAMEKLDKSGRKYGFSFALVRFNVTFRQSKGCWDLQEWIPTLGCYDFLQEFDTPQDAHDWVKENF